LLFSIDVPLRRRAFALMRLVACGAQEEDAQGPRAKEMMMRTTYAKQQYDLTTSDIMQIQGFRRKATWYRP
jgi:hypothetical protein